MKSKRTKHKAFQALLAAEMLKKCTWLWRETRFEIKMRKGAPLAVEMFKKCMKHISKSKVLKTDGFGRLFEAWVRVLGGRRNGYASGRKMSKVSQACGFCSRCANGGRRGMFEEDL